MNFAELEIWKDQKTFANMEWYYKVANNEMPAKYLIARRIPCNLDLDDDEDELWNEHKRLSESFDDLWTAIRNGDKKLADVPVAHPSLMELNAELSTRMLSHCEMCRWNCKVDRTNSGKRGTCKLDTESRVSSYFHHRGEELVFRGTHGSGTIFFSSCNLRCVFCQNGDISKDKDNGMPIDATDLSHMIKILRLEGCHNINFVGGDPQPHLHTIINAINMLDNTPLDVNNPDLLKVKMVKSDYYFPYPLDLEYGVYAATGEFNAPMLWNSNFFMSEKSYQILRTVIDIWLPDFKFFSNKCSVRLSRTSWYLDTITTYLQKIYDTNESFAIRHLIMPNHVDCCSIPILHWIKEHIPNAPINLMGQFHPDSFTNPNTREYNPRYEDLSRRVSQSEIVEVIQEAEKLGINFETLTYK